jgi:O-antigen ligase
MMNKSVQSHQGKEKSGFWLLNPASKFESLLLTLFFLLLPTQFGKHFWPDFSSVAGIRIDYLSLILYTTDVLLVLLFLSVFIRVVLQKKLQFVFNRTQVAFLAFLGIFFLCNIIFSLRPLLTLYGFGRYLELFFLGMYLAAIIKRFAKLQLIAFLFAVSASFESILAVLQYLSQSSLNGFFYLFGERAFTGATPGIANVSLAGDLILRPYATFPHPNVLAGYLLVAILFIWFFLRQTSWRWLQFFSVISLLLSSVALLLTFSRLAIAIWSILVLSVLVRLAISKLQTSRQKLFATLLFVVAVASIGVLPISQDIGTRFTQTSFSEESFVERSELLSAAFTLFTQHPLVGVGLDNFLPALAPLQKPMPLNLYLQPVHNIFLLVAAETGIVGFILFLILLIATYRRIWGQDKKVKSFFLLALSIILVTGMFDHYWLTLQQGQLLFATILGLSWKKLQK